MRILFSAVFVAFVFLTGSSGAQDAAATEAPEETFKALGLDKTASPRELYDALVKRYNDPSEGAGKGSLSEF